MFHYCMFHALVVALFLTGVQLKPQPEPKPFDFKDRETEQSGRLRAGGVIIFPDRPGGRRPASSGAELDKPRVNQPGDAGPTILPEPSCIEGRDYCSEIEGYPMDAMMVAAGEMTKEVEDMFKHPYEIHNRIIPDKRGSRACESMIESTYPQVARNVDDEFMWIMNDIRMNDSVTYAQRVDSELCRSEGKNTCNNLVTQGLPEGYTADCRQQYSYKKLLALSRTGSKVIDTFKMPSSCVCYLVNRDPLFRFRPGNDLPEKLKMP